MRKVLYVFLFFVAFVAIAVLLTSWNLKRVTTNTYNKYVVNAPFDAIIVPGLPYEPSKQNILFKARILWAKSLFEKGIAKNIIFSGAAVHTPWIEARIMKILSDSLGVSPANTFAEQKAEHGNENIYYSYQLAQKLGFKKIALATDQYQNSFLSSFIEKRLPDIAQLPVSVDSFPVYDKIQLPGIETKDAFAENFIPLEKRESRWQRFRSSWSSEIKEK